MWAILGQRIEFLYVTEGVLVLKVTLIYEANTLLSGWWLMILVDVGCLGQRIEFLYDIAGVLVLKVTLINEANTLLLGWWLSFLEEVGSFYVKR